ncbi:helix-turn-helix domain-containing protein [Sphingomonas solaris]|uniref:Transcriptional regulator n=1 Tax=Alterirhizorhabdus solaris TaxID=2529389 RepID=A0A558R9S9_9SPHN|nr:helix-turn-helix domain-containing protein [Sphingomonas solaris]TVV76143.1 transcriptional regulator [Sphingomonas solaris]
MTIGSMHREDVKAALRKTYGSVFEFERLHQLPRKSVSDVLRGRPNQRVTSAIEKVLEATAR